MRALEEAREALATAGASERAAEADALLAEGWWYVAERDRCFDHLARAEDVVRDSVPSSAKARVLSQVARYRALAGDYEQAIEAAEEALAIADQLGLDEFRADALLNISLANAQRGHFVEAIAIARRAIEIALSINSPVAARGLNNLGAHLARSGDEQEGLRTRQEAIRVAERLGSPLIRRYSRGVIDLAPVPGGSLGRGDLAWRRAHFGERGCSRLHGELRAVHASIAEARARRRRGRPRGRGAQRRDCETGTGRPAARTLPRRLAACRDRARVGGRGERGGR